MARVARVHDAIRKVDDRRLCLYTVAAKYINTLPHAVGAKEALVGGRHERGVGVRLFGTCAWYFVRLSRRLLVAGALLLWQPKASE